MHLSIQYLVSTTHFTAAAPYIKDAGGDELVNAGVQVSFNCTADGVPTPSIKWLKGGTVVSTSVGKQYKLAEKRIPTGLRDNINESISSVLTIFGMTESDTGLYVCAANNGRGRAVVGTPFNLTVLPLLPPNYCANNPCLNGGLCESGPTTFVCKCTNLYKGATCDEGETMYMLVVQV